ncbi:MAG: glycosyltransferase, partial [Clostridia bacterium]|nr:glycosyltransferase [Clostridia bacterium]
MNASDREKADTVNTPLKPLISVIVPIYNVEKYVRKCLESLVNQTMKQIEVICIDDGSTDSSGAIADEYCNTDAERNGKEW